VQADLDAGRRQDVAGGRELRAERQVAGLAGHQADVGPGGGADPRESPAPAEVVITGQHLAGPAVTSAISRMESLAAAGGPIRPPVTATSVADGRALIISVPLAGNGGDSASSTALDALRDRILPRTFAGTGASYAVAGDTAANHDDTSQLSARTPLVLAVVAAVAFCLLLLSFRSVVLPLVSIALNFLSVAAAYGLITVIFQDGRLQGLLGYASSGAITPGYRRSCSASRWTTTSSS
jgi:RND superfamily putative drug exporter